MLSRKHYCCFWYILYGTWKEKCQLNNVPIPVILDFDIKRTLGCPRFVWNFLSHLLVNNKGDNIISFAFQLTWNTCSTINENDVREEMRCAVTSKDGPLIRILMHFSYKEEIYKLLLIQYHLKRFFEKCRFFKVTDFFRILYWQWRYDLLLNMTTFGTQNKE